MRLFILLSFAVALMVSASAYAGPNIRITEIQVVDDGSVLGSSAIPLVDTVQDVCPADEPFAEPFYDSVARIKVVNRTRTMLRFSSLKFRFGQGGASFISNEISPGNFFEVPAGKSGTFVASLFLWVNSGRKYFPGSDAPVAAWAGPMTIQFTLQGRDGRRKRVATSAATTVNFANYDRCPAR